VTIFNLTAILTCWSNSNPGHVPGLDFVRIEREFSDLLKGRAVSKTRNISRDTYDSDENLRLALIHLVQTIGEAARQVSREFCNTLPEIR
jgi:hypothetical protein